MDVLEEIWRQLAAPLTGAILIVLYRLIDRYLPDPEHKHPLPDSPATGGGHDT